MRKAKSHMLSATMPPAFKALILAEPDRHLYVVKNDAPIEKLTTSLSLSSPRHHETISLRTSIGITGTSAPLSSMESVEREAGGKDILKYAKRCPECHLVQR